MKVDIGLFRGPIIIIRNTTHSHEQVKFCWKENEHINNDFIYRMIGFFDLSENFWLRTEL